MSNINAIKKLNRIRIILLFAFTFCGTLIFAQVTDKQKKSIRIPAEPSKTEKDSMPLKIKVAPKFESETEKAGGKADNSKKYITKDYRRPFSMIEQDGLKSPSEIYEKRWSKDLAKGGVIKTMSDQFLGEHRVDTKFVNIICRDHEYPDGDRVRIHINGVVIKESLLLQSSYRRVEVDLADGRNTVEIEALNQGESGPNTAEFVVYDDKGRLISSKEWNLLTGVKAIIVFQNEKVIIKEKSTSDQASADTNTSNNE